MVLIVRLVLFLILAPAFVVWALYNAVLALLDDLGGPPGPSGYA